MLSVGSMADASAEVVGGEARRRFIRSKVHRRLRGKRGRGARPGWVQRFMANTESKSSTKVSRRSRRRLSRGRGGVAAQNGASVASHRASGGVVEEMRRPWRFSGSSGRLDEEASRPEAEPGGSPQRLGFGKTQRRVAAHGGGSTRGGPPVAAQSGRRGATVTPAGSRV